jgi:hypothetical protein
MPHDRCVEETPRERLSRLMDERRRFLRRTWDQVAVDASITYETIRQVRGGTGEIRPLTKRGIEDALRWTPGSVDRILQGGAPGEFEVRPGDLFALTLDPVEKLIQEIYADESMPEERKQELVRLIRQAEAQREAELRAAQDELSRWRTRRAAG